MNTIILNAKSGSVKARDLPAWLMSNGITVFSTQEAAYLLGVPDNQVRQRLAPLRHRGAVATAGRGIWLAVPADRMAWGAPEPMSYIDGLMESKAVDYVVGWLSAAALRGASHQGAQVFQVAVDRQVRRRIVGRSRLEFYRRDYVGTLPSECFTIPSGRAKVARTEAVMLMLVDDLALAGGIHNAVTAIIELAHENEGWESRLAEASRLFPTSAGRRCGWILERFALEGASYDRELDGLARACAAKGGISRLDPHCPATGCVDRRWGLDVNIEVEPDV